jgi:peptide deformylase
MDLAGDELDIEADELLARVFQHEVDHLDGILLLERVTPDERKDAMRALRQRALGLPTDRAEAH